MLSLDTLKRLNAIDPRWQKSLVIAISLLIVGASYLALPRSSSSPAEELSPAKEVSRPASASRMKLKYFWSYELKSFERCNAQHPTICEAYFQCDYTSQTCQRGYRILGGQGLFLYELLAEDRKTAIAHQFCRSGSARGVCLNFDTGEARSYGSYPGGSVTSNT